MEYDLGGNLFSDFEPNGVIFASKLKGKLSKRSNFFNLKGKGN